MNSWTKTVDPGTMENSQTGRKIDDWVDLKDNQFYVQDTYISFNPVYRPVIPKWNHEFIYVLKLNDRPTFS